MHLNVAESGVTDVEITWDTESFNITLKAAALAVLEFLFDSISHIATRSCLLFICLNGELIAIRVKSMFKELTVVVGHPVAHLILEGEPDNIAWHLRHNNIDVNMELVLRV